MRIALRSIVSYTARSVLEVFIASSAAHGIENVRNADDAALRLRGSPPNGLPPRRAAFPRAIAWIFVAAACSSGVASIVATARGATTTSPSLSAVTLRCVSTLNAYATAPTNDPGGSVVPLSSINSPCVITCTSAGATPAAWRTSPSNNPRAHSGMVDGAMASTSASWKASSDRSAEEEEETGGAR